MALSAAPKGLSPVGTVTGAAYNEQGRLYYIANDASNTYAIGDIVVAAAGADSGRLCQRLRWSQPVLWSGRDWCC